MARKTLPGSTLKSRRRRRRVIIVLSAFLCLFVIVAGAIGSSWLPFIRIDRITISGASSVSEENIKDVMQKRLAGTLYYLIPRDNIFFYDRDAMKKDLLSAYPVLQSVDIRRLNLQTLTVKVVERKTTALWCGGSIASESPCYLLDNSGVAYASAADFSAEIYIKYYGDVSGGAAKQYLTKELFGAVSAFALTLAGVIKDETISSVEVVGEDVDVHFASGFVLRYSTKDSVGDVIDRLKLALGADPFSKHKLADFEYLDLRFGDKLYYKLK